MSFRLDNRKKKEKNNKEWYKGAWKGKMNIQSKRIVMIQRKKEKEREREREWERDRKRKR